MTIHGEITFEDYQKFVRGGARSSIFTISLGVIGVGVVPSLLQRRFDPLDLVVLICLFLMVAAIYFGPRLFGKSAEKNFLKIKSLQGLRRIEMNADGIAFSSPTVNFTERWARHFRTYAVGSGYTVLYEAGTDYQIFPQRWFTDEQYAQFQTYLRNSLGKSAV